MTRRFLIKAVGAGFLAGLAGCTGRNSEISPSSWKDVFTISMNNDVDYLEQGGSQRAIASGTVSNDSDKKVSHAIIHVAFYDRSGEIYSISKSDDIYDWKSGVVMEFKLYSEPWQGSYTFPVEKARLKLIEYVFA